MSYQIVFTNELYHHGIKGQKWGTRRWQNEDGTFNTAGKERYFGKRANKFQAKADKYGERFKNSKTFIGRSINNRLQFENQYKANVAKNLDKSKTLKDKISNIAGAGKRKALYDANAQYYQNKLDTSKTRLGKTYNEAAVYNMKQMSKAESKVQRSSNVKDYVKNTINKNWNTPLKTWSGRDTTQAKQYIDTYITGFGPIKDIGYYIHTGKQQEKANKENK